MEERTTFSAIQFCRHHQIEFSFVQSLQELGLLHAERAPDEDWLVASDDLDRLESLVRLHYDLQINIEGLDAIEHLLEQLQALQQEVGRLRSRLRLYEPSDSGTESNRSANAGAW